MSSKVDPDKAIPLPPPTNDGESGDAGPASPDAAASAPRPTKPPRSSRSEKLFKSPRRSKAPRPPKRTTAEAATEKAEAEESRTAASRGRRASDVHDGPLAAVATAIMFLTRLPVGLLGSGDPAVLSRATRWFPLVGLLVGGLLGATWALAQTFLPSSIAVFGVLVAGVLVTGAFHEDGLADVADSAGAFGREAKLDIMRDSRVGTYGAVALVLLVLGRFVLLWELSVMPLVAPLAALIAAHVLARWSSVWLMARVPYARPNSSNRVISANVDLRRLAEASVVAALALVPAVWLGGWLAVLVAIPVALLVTLVAGWRFRRSIGGITGDCLGATNVLVELAVLLTVLVFAAP